MKTKIHLFFIALALLAGVGQTCAQIIPLYSFTDSGGDDKSPQAGLVQASDGNLYGTTLAGGTNGDGVVFRITTDGVETPLYSFTDGHDGADPQAGLVQASDGNLYGTTFGGGTNQDGVVFRITTNGVFTPLYSFTDGHDGAGPEAGLVQASDGNLYGTTQGSGTNGYGVVFRITTNGVETPLYSFTGSGGDGRAPIAGLVQASDGNLYGTTYYGGTNNNYGVVFRITTNGVETVTSSFNGADDGADPEAGLVQASNGNLYGTTGGGGTNNDGTVFELIIPPVPIPLNIQLNDQALVLSWNDPASVFSLQSAPDLASVFTNIPGATNPYTNTITASQQFFRLADP